MNRPYTICHMITSIDGKITGNFFYDERFSDNFLDYYRLHKEFKADGFLCGRVTMNESFPQEKPEVEKGDIVIEKVDFVATKADFYAVAIDQSGKLWWNNSHIQDEDEGYNNAHVIEVVTEMVSNEFLHYLKSKNVSYIFCGKEEVDLNVLMDKLYNLFGIKKLLVEGGGYTNSLFEAEGLIDEVSIVVVPTIELKEDAKLNFSGLGINNYTSDKQNVFKLEKAEVLDNNGLWLNYKK